MFNFTHRKFSPDCNVFVYEFNDDKRILSGCFFNENTILQQIPDNEEISLKNIILNDNLEIAQILKNIDIIIINKLEDLINWPYILKKYEKDNIIILTTEPIIQIGQVYCNEFYTWFNRLILDLDDSSSIYITELDLIRFFNYTKKLNYNEKYLIDDCLETILSPSGYNLGSSNTIFYYFNKKISILNNSSRYDYRYPKCLDINILNDSDILILLPDVINYKVDYSYEMSKLLEYIYRVSSKTDVDITSYPYLFMPCSPLFILDYVDFMRFKIPKENKNIFIGRSIKAILEYCNISHGYINTNVHKKIYDFMLPFNFDELYKNNSFICYNDLEEMLQTDLTRSPICIMVFNFSYSIGDAKTIYEYFSNNSTNLDSFIKMNRYLKVDENNNFKVFEFNPDYRINLSDFENILKIVKPEMLLISDSDNEIKKFSTIYHDNIKFSTIFEMINYQKAYYISNNEKQSNMENFLNSPLSLNITKENERIFINTITINPFFAKTDLEKFENDLDQMLLSNNMKINEFYSCGEKIEIRIIKNTNESYAEVIINLSQSDPDISITCENYNDTYFLNNVFVLLFN